MSEAVGRPPEIDTSRPSIARVYDAMLGGKDNFAVDRELLAHLGQTAPEIRGLLPGLELVEPGLVPVNEWWPEGPRINDDGYMVQLLLGVVAWKP